MSAPSTVTTVDGHEIPVVQSGDTFQVEDIEHAGLRIFYAWSDGSFYGDENCPWTLTGDISFLAHRDAEEAVLEDNHDWSERACALARSAGIGVRNDSEASQAFLYLRTLDDARRFADLLAAARRAGDAWLVPVAVPGEDTIVGVAVNASTFDDACAVAGRLSAR